MKQTGIWVVDWLLSAFAGYREQRTKRREAEKRTEPLIGPKWRQGED
jgi:hypothetical protein